MVTANHLPPILRNDHLVGEALKLDPEVPVVQCHLQVPLRGVSLAAPCRQLGLNSRQDVRLRHSRSAPPHSGVCKRNAFKTRLLGRGVV